MIPFGVGVGDFIAVGKLIGQIVVELRENGAAAPEYQSLILELEALDRALHQLNELKPGRHELSQLNSIRATALFCERPLQKFLVAISKFDARLGTTNVKANRYKGFPRRMQYQLFYKKDVKELRAVLGSHIATINLLLMTQTVRSISAAENDRVEIASGLEQKILAHRRLLEDVNASTETSNHRHSETNAKLQDQATTLNTLVCQAEYAKSQLQDQSLSLQEVQSVVESTREQSASILASTTRILSLVTSGLMTLRSISEQMGRMFKLFAEFTVEMRLQMAKLLQLFSLVQASLCRIEGNLPMRIGLPIVQFTDALGETMALPYNLCQQWSTFKELLSVVFIGKVGKSRVDLGQYLIMHGKGGRLLKEMSWKDSIKQDDHLSMCIVLDELIAKEGCCPFPRCQASLQNAEARNGGLTCSKCARWALSTPRRLDEESENSGDSNHDYEKDRDGAAVGKEPSGSDDDEDIDAYRLIRVQTINDAGAIAADRDIIIVSENTHEDSSNRIPIKGILKKPRKKFPEDPRPIREGIAPLNAGRDDVPVPHGARWTKINRKLVNPEALELGRERYEAGDDFVIVLRVLSREEVQGYTEVTQKLRQIADAREETITIATNPGVRIQESTGSIQATLIDYEADDEAEP